MNQSMIRWPALSAFGALTLAGVLLAQPPGDDGKERRGPPRDGEGGNAGPLQKLMAMDANGDGKLTADEVTDARLKPLFERIDANHDGVIDRAEIDAFVAKDQQGQGGSGKSAKGKRGGPGGGGPGGGGGGPPKPGTVLPDFLQQDLNLTATQKKQLAALQRDVDTRLQKILTAEQRQMLENHGPPGFGGPPPDEGDGPSGRSESGPPKSFGKGAGKNRPMDGGKGKKGPPPDDDNN